MAEALVLELLLLDYGYYNFTFTPLLNELLRAVNVKVETSLFNVDKSHYVAGGVYNLILVKIPPYYVESLLRKDINRELGD